MSYLKIKDLRNYSKIKKQGNELQKVGTVHHISAQETVLVVKSKSKQ